MITDIKQLDLTKSYSYADYLTWQFSERVELIKGMIKKMSPAPNMRHQQVAGNVYYHLRKSLEGQVCKIFEAPCDVRLLSEVLNTSDEQVFNVVQPDIFVVCDVTKIEEQSCLGAPDLIIEILSKGNSKRDIQEKFELYEGNKVPEYWIVSASDETITVFDLIEDKYLLRKIYSVEDEIEVKILNSIMIKGIDIFEN